MRLTRQRARSNSRALFCLALALIAASTWVGGLWGFPGPTGPLVACFQGGSAFPAAVLDTPAGTGPVPAGAAAALGRISSSFGAPGSPPLVWRLAARGPFGATFLASTEYQGRTDWHSANLISDPFGLWWHPLSWGDCSLQRALPSGYKLASWWIDPAYPPLGPGSAEVHLLVVESCVGLPPPERIWTLPVEVSGDDANLTIAIAPALGFQWSSSLVCRLAPPGQGTPWLVKFPAPLGQRVLLNGGPVPPTPIQAAVAPDNLKIGP